MTTFLLACVLAACTALAGHFTMTGFSLQRLPLLVIGIALMSGCLMTAEALGFGFWGKVLIVYAPYFLVGGRRYIRLEHKKAERDSRRGPHAH